MKRKSQFLLFVISLFFIGCNNGGKKSITLISNIGTDFSTSEKLEFKPFNKYNIPGEGFCVIEDSVLWNFNDGKEDIGYCYHLNTGDKLSVIASKGFAENELKELAEFYITNNSVVLFEDRNIIKTFAKKDILNNIPLENRKVSVTVAPNNILSHKMAKLPNGSTLATIRPPFEAEKEKMDDINNKSVVIFNNNDIKSYETINYDSFDIEEATNKQIDANELIKWTYAQGNILVKDNNIAAFSASHQFILYTLDLNTGDVVNEKRYTKLLRDNGEMSFTSTNDMNLNINAMKANDKYILCLVRGYLSDEDKESKLPKEEIFVFDWNLTPIKKFELPDSEGKYGYYTISNDCHSVYFCEYNRDEISLYKADLNL